MSPRLIRCLRPGQKRYGRRLYRLAAAEILRDLADDLENNRIKFGSINLSVHQPGPWGLHTSHGGDLQFDFDGQPRVTSERGLGRLRDLQDKYGDTDLFTETISLAEAMHAPPDEPPDFRFT